MTENEINLLNRILKSTLKVDMLLINLPLLKHISFDHDLRVMLFQEFDYSSYLENIFAHLNDNSVYCFKDSYQSHYAFIKVPNTEQSFLVIGPYLLDEVNDLFIEEVIEHNNLTNAMKYPLLQYYLNTPMVDSSVIISTLNEIASFIFGDAKSYIVKFRTENWLNNDVDFDFIPNPEISMNTKAMEDRYSIENELLDAISKGDRRLAIHNFHKFCALNLEKHLTDPIRNLKNQAIILNTLYRKSIEKGFIHPIYLDEISKKYALLIEQASSEQLLKNLMLEMTRKYCVLVKDHSLKNHSPIIRKTIDYINLNLSIPLSLNKIAAQLSINPSYLSSLFKREMSITLTDYINQQRMNTAIQLLKTTDMHIQSIAWYVGINDVNYFSRLFKKVIGKTPTEYKIQIKQEE